MGATIKDSLDNSNLQNLSVSGASAVVSQISNTSAYYHWLIINKQFDGIAVTNANSAMGGYVTGTLHMASLASADGSNPPSVVFGCAMEHGNSTVGHVIPISMGYEISGTGLILRCRFWSSKSISNASFYIRALYLIGNLKV